MSSRIAKLVFSAAFAAFSLGGVDKARADDPLSYPPFSWPSDKPDKSSPARGKDTAKPGKPNIYQNKDETKQWYDGDFLGMDDD